MSDLFAPAALSVSALNALAKQLLEQNLFGLWVGGEVSNLTRAASGHYYFSLKDDRAQVRCVLFKGVAAQLAAPLQEGDDIELTGRIGIYEARGEFQITVTEVRHKGLGRLYEAYERLKQRLQAEGLFDPARKQPLPARPQRIGIVTSLAAAALRDVLTTLKRRHGALHIIIYPTAVQGAGSEQQIAQAVRTADERQEVDVLIVCRGGGSIEDLWAFNEEVVVRAIAACRLPVVCGVGHETDFTLADFAADLRAPTPTAAAELVSPDRRQQIQQLAAWQRLLHERFSQRYFDNAQKLDWLARQLRHPRQDLAARQQRLHTLNGQLQQAVSRQLGQQQQRLQQALRQWRLSRPDTAAARQQLLLQQQRLQSGRAQRLQQAATRLQHMQQLLDAVSPQHILERGFSVVTDSRGRVVRDSHGLRTGQSLHIRFAHGETDVRVGVQQQRDLFE
nr:exodeoxyribonuclease VII large subunit [Neisseria sp. HSC-16F19]